MKKWIKIVGSEATHHFLRDEIVAFTYASKFYWQKDHPPMTGLGVKLKSGLNTLIIGDQSTEKQMLKQMGMSERIKKNEK